MNERTPEERAKLEERMKLARDNAVYENGNQAHLAMTKLEYMATTIMAGFAACPDSIADHRKLACLAIDYANSILYALEDAG